MKKPFKHALIGGTMDAFHDGHKQYVDLAYSLADSVTIYVNSEEFVQPKKIYQVKPWVHRANIIQKFIEKRNYSSPKIIKIRNLSEIRNLLEESDFDVVIVAPDRKKLVAETNRLRSKPYEVILKTRTKLPSGGDLSSTAISSLSNTQNKGG